MAPSLWLRNFRCWRPQSGLVQVPITDAPSDADGVRVLDWSRGVRIFVLQVPVHNATDRVLSFGVYVPHGNAEDNIFRLSSSVPTCHRCDSLFMPVCVVCVCVCLCGA